MEYWFLLGNILEMTVLHQIENSLEMTVLHQTEKSLELTVFNNISMIWWNYFAKVISAGAIYILCYVCTYLILN